MQTRTKGELLFLEFGTQCNRHDKLHSSRITGGVEADRLNLGFWVEITTLTSGWEGLIIVVVSWSN